jgi:aerobic carbon-monoxide dehydrogenase large subunit
MKFALGQAVPRTEDPRLLTGRGRYTDDFVLQRLAHAYVLRSPYAHAHIRSVDIRGAQQMPGVLAVLTGEDWAAEKFGAPRPVIPRQRRDGSPMFVPPRPALVKDRAMLVSDPVAFIVAESVDLAKDAAERIARRVRAASLRHRNGRGAATGRSEALGGMPRQRVLLLHLGRQACR